MRLRVFRARVYNLGLLLEMSKKRRGFDVNIRSFIPKTPGPYMWLAGALGAALVAAGFLLAEESTQIVAAVGQVAGGVITILTIVAGAVARAKNQKPRE
jgi:hypothetical protein